jgi:hypothetical protein
VKEFRRKNKVEEEKKKLTRAIATKFPAPEGGRRDDHENASDGRQGNRQKRYTAALRSSEKTFLGFRELALDGCKELIPNYNLIRVSHPSISSRIISGI